jgi:hypothetical protein
VWAFTYITDSLNWQLPLDVCYFLVNSTQLWVTKPIFPKSRPHGVYILGESEEKISKIWTCTLIYEYLCADQFLLYIINLHQDKNSPVVQFCFPEHLEQRLAYIQFSLSFCLIEKDLRQFHLPIFPLNIQLRLEKSETEITVTVTTWMTRAASRHLSAPVLFTCVNHRCMKLVKMQVTSVAPSPILSIQTHPGKNENKVHDSRFSLFLQTLVISLKTWWTQSKVR